MCLVIGVFFVVVSSSPDSQTSARGLSVVPRVELTGAITVNRMTSNGWFFLEQFDDSDFVSSDVDIADDEDESMSDKSSAPQASPPPRMSKAMRLSAKWTPRSAQWKRLHQNINSPNHKLPQGYYHIDRVVDVRATSIGMEYMVVWADAPISEKRSWIQESHFIEISWFQADIEMCMKWKQSGLSKRDFMRTNPDARKWMYRRRSVGADGVRGWCAYNCVGTALELLGVNNPVTSSMITDFVAVGAKRRKLDPEKIVGVRFVALVEFVRQLRRIGICIDMDAFTNRRKLGEVGLKGVAFLCTESGVYLVAGFPGGRSAEVGHCVVLDVQDSSVIVYDEDEMLDVEDLEWLYELSFVCRVKLEKFCEL
jgi:hypothetical protein